MPHLTFKKLFVVFVFMAAFFVPLRMNSTTHKITVAAVLAEEDEVLCWDGTSPPCAPGNEPPSQEECEVINPPPGCPGSAPTAPAVCTELESGTWEGAPSPMAIICPIARFLNVLVLSAAAVFVVFILLSAIKYALSQGDPKALMASQQTLTTTVIGFFIVIGVYTLLTIIKNVLGLTSSPILNPFEVLTTNLRDLLTKFGISGY